LSILGDMFNFRPQMARAAAPLTGTPEEFLDAADRAADGDIINNTREKPMERECNGTGPSTRRQQCNAPGS
jgi:hypothetical protein